MVFSPFSINWPHKTGFVSFMARTAMLGQCVQLLALCYSILSWAFHSFGNTQLYLIRQKFINSLSKSPAWPFKVAVGMLSTHDISLKIDLNNELVVDTLISSKILGKWLKTLVFPFKSCPIFVNKTRSIINFWKIEEGIGK